MIYDTQKLTLITQEEGTIPVCDMYRTQVKYDLTGYSDSL